MSELQTPITWTAILCRTQGPVNLGMIMRLCRNVGIEELRLVDPLCDPQDDDARRFANHARDHLATVPQFDSLSEALADQELAIATTARVRDQRYGQAVSLHELQEVTQQRSAHRVALVFGNEADGLSAEELACCPIHLHLDTPGDYPSYNLANAVAIIGHHVQCMMSNTDSPPTLPQPEAAPMALQQQLTEYWLDSLERFNYFRGNRSRDQFAAHFQQLIHRLALNKEDATVLWGCLAQFNYFAFEDKFLKPDNGENQPAK